jgi:hypothetical protein
VTVSPGRLIGRPTVLASLSGQSSFGFGFMAIAADFGSAFDLLETFNSCFQPTGRIGSRLPCKFQHPLPKENISSIFTSSF